MSLRREIHAAFETIAPPLGGMPERVVQTVLADKRRRRNKEMLVRFRAPLSLVAALVVIALVAAVLVGGRLIQDWNQFHNAAPAGGIPSVTLGELEARPVTLPVVTSDGACPHNPGTNSRYYALGSGPVFANGGSAIPTTWGTYFDVAYFTDGHLTGLVLIRGRDLRDQSRIVVFVGEYAAGPVVGTDPELSTGGQYPEAVIDAGRPPAKRPNGDGVWAVRQGLPASASNCFGFQIDTAKGSERFTGGT